MRPTIVLLSPMTDHQKLVARIHGAGSYRKGSILDYLDRGECRFGVDVSGAVMGEFDEEEISELSMELGEFEAVLIEYSEVACIRALLMEVLPGVHGIVDTNHGERLSYENVLERFSRDPSWDWRSQGGEMFKG